MKPVYLLLGLSLVTLIITGCSDQPKKLTAMVPTPTLSPVNNKNLTPAPQQITIERIIDGDTVEIRLSSGLQDTVRLIGVDTPEVSKSNRSDEYKGVTDVLCLDLWGARATEFAETYLIEQKQGVQTMTLETDSLTGERGYYNRLLAYIIVDGIDFNSLLVENGYARVYTEEPFSKASAYLSLEKSAQQQNIGLWSCKSTQVSTLTPTPPIAKQHSSNLACDPSYPTVCIPSYPPDLDCGEIPYRRFTVLETDPHGFDRDNDGIGCET